MVVHKCSHDSSSRDSHESRSHSDQSGDGRPFLSDRDTETLDHWTRATQNFVVCIHVKQGSAAQCNVLHYNNITRHYIRFHYTTLTPTYTLTFTATSTSTVSFSHVHTFVRLQNAHAYRDTRVHSETYTQRTCIHACLRTRTDKHTNNKHRHIHACIDTCAHTRKVHTYVHAVFHSSICFVRSTSVATSCDCASGDTRVKLGRGCLCA